MDEDALAPVKHDVHAAEHKEQRFVIRPYHQHADGVAGDALKSLSCHFDAILAKISIQVHGQRMGPAIVFLLGLFRGSAA